MFINISTKGIKLLVYFRDVLSQWHLRGLLLDVQGCPRYILQQIKKNIREKRNRSYDKSPYTNRIENTQKTSDKILLHNDCWPTKDG